MYFPPPWHNQALKGSSISGDYKTGWSQNWMATRLDGHKKFGGLQDWMVTKWWKGVTYPQPEDICIVGEYGCSVNTINGGRHDWCSNYTLIPGEPTLPRDMVLTSDNKYERMMRKKHPWAAPGTATVFGEGCGVNGGNPQGCWETDPFPYGHCCVINGKVSHECNLSF